MGRPAGRAHADLERDPLRAILRRAPQRSRRPAWTSGAWANSRRHFARSSRPRPAQRCGSTSAAPRLAVVLDRRRAVLDDATRDAVERRLFDAWLGERRRTAHVQWFWGNEARTAKATEG